MTARVLVDDGGGVLGRGSGVWVVAERQQLLYLLSLHHDRAETYAWENEHLHDTAAACCKACALNATCCP